MSNYQSEDILVVPRSVIITEDIPHSGIKIGSCDAYLNCIKKYQQFLPRSAMELDVAFKQIIPYLVFKYEDRYFVMQRKKTASEVRLQSKFTLGIGGHIRKEDMTHNSIIAWARREFYEEVSYAGNFEIEPIGIINDDTNTVGQVHLGFLFLLHADSNNIAIRSELQSGTLMTLDECIALKDCMETWSQFVINYLQNKKI